MEWKGGMNLRVSELLSQFQVSTERLVLLNLAVKSIAASVGLSLFLRTSELVEEHATALAERGGINPDRVFAVGSRGPASGNDGGRVAAGVLIAVRVLLGVNAELEGLNREVVGVRITRLGAVEVDVCRHLGLNPDGSKGHREEGGFGHHSEDW